MVRKLVAATALALVSAAPASAALFTVTFSAPNIEIINGVGAPPNDFGALLGTHFGLLSSVNQLTSITLSDAGNIGVDFLASESALVNSFTIGVNSLGGPLTFNEVDNNFIPGGVHMGVVQYGAATDLTDEMFFAGGVSDGTISPPPNGDGFAVFLPALTIADLAANPLQFTSLGGGLWTFTTDTLYIGYDDWLGDNTSDDDNHDDMIVRLSAAVPESSTWAMLIAGFMTVGAAMRRRGGRKLVQAV